MRGVARASRGVVAHAPRGQISAKLAGEVAGADVVGSDDHERPVAERLGVLCECGDQVRLDRPGRVSGALIRPDGSTKRRVVAVVVGKLQGGPKRHS